MTIGSRMPCMREHCWHGLDLAVVPVKTTEVCCHCGVTQSHWRLRTASPPPAHGRYLPRTEA